MEAEIVKFKKGGPDFPCQTILGVSSYPRTFAVYARHNSKREAGRSNRRFDKVHQRINQYEEQFDVLVFMVTYILIELGLPKLQIQLLIDFAFMHIKSNSHAWALMFDNISDLKIREFLKAMTKLESKLTNEDDKPEMT